MTFHTRAATDEIYSIFNQPLKAETSNAADSVYGSDYDDDDYTSAGESTATGRISATSSEFGDDETNVLETAQEDEDDEGDYEDETRAESVGVSEWTEFSPSKHVPKVTPHDSEDVPPEDATGIQGQEDLKTPADDTDHQPRRQRFIPQMPEDYNPPIGPYRDPEVMAQNRLPFMTPILERTECSFPSMTVARNNMYDAKTPCKPMQANSHTPPGMPQVEDLLLSTPIGDAKTPQGNASPSVSGVASPSPAAKKPRPSPEKKHALKNIFQRAAIIKDAQCNPTDPGIRNTILKSIDPPLSSYAGYHDHADKEGNFSAEIQKFAKALTKRPKSGEKFSVTPPILSFPGADREYSIRRELGAGAFAPVYLAESVDALSDSESETVNENNKRSLSLDKSRKSQRNHLRHGFEAIKMEIGKPNPWEFYIIRTAHDRLRRSAELSRAAESIVCAHELHLFKDETFLVEDYRCQGTLLDLVNVVRSEGITANGTAEAGLDESLAMFFTVELFRTVEALHTCGILHGDIKPDNCLVRFDEKSSSNTASLLDLGEEELADPREVHYSPRGLYNWRDKGLTLIDFGRGIDMRAFQPSVQFIADWETGKHECNEMREMRPWTHQIDLYGIAGTVHVMLFGKYIESVPVRGDENASPNGRHSGHGLAGGSSPSASSKKRYRIRESLKRYWDREIWTDVFDLLLNPGADRWVEMEMERGGSGSTSNGTGAILPVLQSMKYVREKMEAWLLANAEKKNLLLQIRKLEAHFAKRKEKSEKRTSI